MPFLATTAVGTLLWTGLLAAAGYVLAEGYRTVGNWIDRAGQQRHRDFGACDIRIPGRDV